MASIRRHIIVHDSIITLILTLLSFTNIKARAAFVLHSTTQSLSSSARRWKLAAASTATSTRISSTTSSSSSSSILSDLLIEYGFGRRMRTISVDDCTAATNDLQQPLLLGELCDHGCWELCRIVGLERQKQQEGSAGKASAAAPRIRIESLAKGSGGDGDDAVNKTAATAKRATTRLVDLGQFTTIWEKATMDDHDDLAVIRDDDCGVVAQELERHLDSISMAQMEPAMQSLYHDVSQRTTSRSPNLKNRRLTKKQISSIVERRIHDNNDNDDDDDDDRRHRAAATAEDVFRKAMKCGEGMVRLVDSAIAMDYLNCNIDDDDNSKNATTMMMLMRRAVSGSLLARDAELGGRFKRMPCIYVGGTEQRNTRHRDDDDDASSSMAGSSISMTFLNGGWLAVDESVRAGAEARKFAQRTASAAPQQQQQLLTVADERIAHRLECLAMGQVLFGNNPGEEELEVDVREALKALNVPASPSGAQQALVKVGRWSSQTSSSATPAEGVKLEPWSPETLNAAKAYAQIDRARRKRLAKACLRSDATTNEMEGRVDLTQIPSICIDAKSTAFRDDAVGIRTRSSTGRKVIAEASNWEVLIHIADVSDIYFSSPVSGLDAEISEPLRQAAIHRGMSRYDLPLGPLHLMPPIALKSLGFITSKDTATQINIPNRCVTVWAYIDERNGKVLDMGLERSLISSPMALSYDEASKYLDSREAMDENHPAYKATAVLARLERTLDAWSKQRKQSSEAARKREERLTAKEIVSRSNNYRFQRTRGHLLVDMSLDLYGVAVSRLLSQHKAPVPRASGSGADRAGRVATAPLRRLVDGMAQLQALSVLCPEYEAIAVKPLTVAECRDINQQANEAMDRLANIRPLKGGSSSSREQQQAVAQLEQRQLGNRVLTAIGTGRGNEVTIQGAVGKCQGVRGSLKAGQKVSVRIQSLNADKGLLKVFLAEN